MRTSTLLAAALAASHAGVSAAAQRRFELVETVRLELPAGPGAVRLWIPKPPSGPVQTARLLGVEAPWPHRLTRDPEFGNELLFLEADSSGGGAVEVRLRYEITRRPQTRSRVNDAPTELDRRPRGLMVVNDEVRALAARATKGLEDPAAKARALYGLVLGRMRYDKSGDGWGRGDTIFACREGRGNCTDFHSLFMSLAIASGIPARFRMGYSVPRAPRGEVSGYHCWAEFHAEGLGWVPVDISEAWKNRRKAEFYFGNLDADRVLVSTGREIRLSPAQRGEPLNFLSRPYAEAGGKPLEGLSLTRRYRELGGRS